MKTENSMEAAALTAPRLGRIPVDAVDGFGCPAEEINSVEKAAPRSEEATGK